MQQTATNFIIGQLHLPDFGEDNPTILAARDLQQMGTWLGVTEQGRFAALTNFRNPGQNTAEKVSRGHIVKSYLAENITPEVFLEKLKKDKDKYAGFNIIVGDPEQLFYYNNIQNDVTEISSGTHGLSSHFLNTPWPKVEKGIDYYYLLRIYLNHRIRVNYLKFPTLCLK